jgi:hypothetical protein
LPRGVHDPPEQERDDQNRDESADQGPEHGGKAIGRQTCSAVGALSGALPKLGREGQPAGRRSFVRPLAYAQPTSRGSADELCPFTAHIAKWRGNVRAPWDPRERRPAPAKREARPACWPTGTPTRPAGGAPGGTRTASGSAGGARPGGPGGRSRTGRPRTLRRAGSA